MVKEFLFDLLIFPLLIVKFIGESIISLIKLALKSIMVIVYICSRPAVRIFSGNTIRFEKKKTIFRKRRFSPLKISIPGISLGLSLSAKRKLRLILIKIRYYIFGALTAFLVFLGIQGYLLVKSLPNPSYISEREIPATTKIFDRKGKLLYEIFSDENRIHVSLEEIPKSVIDATIAIEDNGFYAHKGFSVKGITRALVRNLKDNRLEGGSTITQQLVRSVFLSTEKTVSRKIKEIILSVWTEQVYSKEKILEMYFNEVAYGGTNWGIEAASQNYFGKKISEVNLPEAAFLAGLPAAPTTYSPFSGNIDLSIHRQREVLSKMLSEGYISPEQYNDALNTKLTFQKPKTPILAPHFVMYAKSELVKMYGLRKVERSGLRVFTTLDLDVQTLAESAVEKRMDGLEKLNVNNAAVLVTDPKKGEILAMVGSRDYFDVSNNGNFNVTLSLRQPGSSIKVVTYAQALLEGYTAGSFVDDRPITFRYGSASYSPVNYDGKYHGTITLRQALACSYNIPAVKLLSAVGMDDMINLARKMGIKSWTDTSGYGLSITLGGAEVTMFDMARVYGTLANGGTMKDLSPFIKVTDWKGEIQPLPRMQETKNVLTPEASFTISSILSDNKARIPAFGEKSELEIPGKAVAVKTGTSDNKRDNWTIGYTDELLTAVWVGNNNNTPMDPRLASGITGAAPIWHSIMEDLLREKNGLTLNKPENMVEAYCGKNRDYYPSGKVPKNCRIIK